MEIQKTDTGNLTPEMIDTLAKAAIIPSNTPASQVQVFAQICKEKGISPFSKHIYLLRYGSKYQAIMGIDGFRFIAERTSLHAGTDAATFDNGMTLDQCLRNKVNKPRSASVTVYKIVSGLRVAFTHEVKYSEFSGSGNWNKMPFQMLAKVAEAHALKKAFPGALSGLHTQAEEAAFMENAGQPEVEYMSDEESDNKLEEIKTKIDAFEDADKLVKEYPDLIPANIQEYHSEQAQIHAKNHYNHLLKSKTNEPSK